MPQPRLLKFVLCTAQQLSVATQQLHSPCTAQTAAYNNAQRRHFNSTCMQHTLAANQADGVTALKFTATYVQLCRSDLWTRC
jgi:phage regulator Rha-like protein